MIAFHYPPFTTSSGVHRTAKFVKYLPNFGYQAVVLSAHPRAYGADRSADEASEGESQVIRSFALDSTRHFGIRGRYPGWLALPDRWISWLPGALLDGLKTIREHRPELIWTTYPIATAHLIGLLLKRLSGLPWVADFRDPMIDEVHPTGHLKRRLFAWIEKKTMQRADRICVTTPGAAVMYRARYPLLDAGKLACIENGFDEEDFAGIANAVSVSEGSERPYVLLHSGTVYPLERDPLPMLDALARLQSRGAISPRRVRVVLRATGHDEYILSEIAERGLQDIVSIAPALSYRQALEEMCGVDGLLLMQAANCNNQIPAKVYEYLRAGKPILGLVDAKGDTAALLKSQGIETLYSLDSVDEIEQGLVDFLSVMDRGEGAGVSKEALESCTRYRRSGELAALFDELLSAGH